MDLLSYGAPAGCPTEAAFVSAVSERGARLEGHGADDGRGSPSTHALSVSIEASEASEPGFRGVLRVRRGSGPWADRRVRGDTCAEVVDALAVVTAIAIREADEAAAGIVGAAEPAMPPAPPATPPPPPAAPAEPTAAPAPPGGEKPAPGPRDELSATGDTGREDIAVEAGTVSFTPTYWVNALGGGTLGLVPGTVVPRYELSFSRANFVSLPDGRDFLLGPVVRVRASYFGPASHTSDDGYSTEFSGILAGVAACWPALYDTTGFVLLGCAGFNAGVMGMTTEGPGDFKREVGVPLAMADLGVESAYNFSDHFHVTLKVETDAVLGNAPPIRSDGSDIFQPSLFTGTALLGLGAHFW